MTFQLEGGSDEDRAVHSSWRTICVQSRSCGIASTDTIATRRKLPVQLLNAGQLLRPQQRCEIRNAEAGWFVPQQLHKFRCLLCR